MKTVIITGASRGIGFETAIAFARAGYKVYATMRKPAKAAALYQKIAEEALNITLARMDVDNDESVKECMETILSENKIIDVLVNNAGVERHGAVEELLMLDFKAVMETNYFGVLRCIKALLPSMRANRQGCIINITSISGKIATSPLGAYAASKFALEAVSEALAQEIKPFNVRVAIVEPGIINTEMANAISDTEHRLYPQTKRFAGLFAASLKTPTPPSFVAGEILGIANSSSWQLRYPIGPDAAPFLHWRSSMTDEEYVDWHAAPDDVWYNAVQSTFGLDARPEDYANVAEETK
jgi:NAD(P)-dependent dehydrogenase (short-subunit alcohol dehydrogenase family)